MPAVASETNVLETSGRTGAKICTSGRRDHGCDRTCSAEREKHHVPKEKSITIGNNKVTVPDRYYKVVYDLTPPQKMIGFIIPNSGSTRPLQDFAVTVDAIEKETGLDFFSLVSRQEQDRLESTITLDAWSW